MVKPGQIWWTELMTRDPDSAREFYSKVIGWTANDVSLSDPMQPAKAGEPNYTIFMNDDGHPVCGVFNLGGPGHENVPPHWFTYIAVEDVDDTVQTVTACGGQVLRPPFDVANVGRIAIIRDPEGAAVGIGTPAK